MDGTVLCMMYDMIDACVFYIHNWTFGEKNLLGQKRVQGYHHIECECPRNGFMTVSVGFCSTVPRHNILTIAI